MMMMMMMMSYWKIQFSNPEKVKNLRKMTLLPIVRKLAMGMSSTRYIG